MRVEDLTIRIWIDNDNCLHVSLRDSVSNREIDEASVDLLELKNRLAATES